MRARTLDEVKALFLGCVVDPDGCRVWGGSLDKEGYGKANAFGGHYRAHRLAYELFVGPIPVGAVIDHLCRNRACVNVEHLEAVSDRVNILRGEGTAAVHARKTHCIRGHEFTLENTITYVTKTGKENRGVGRACRTCVRAGEVRRYRERKLEAS